MTDRLTLRAHLLAHPETGLDPHGRHPCPRCHVIKSAIEISSVMPEDGLEGDAMACSTCILSSRREMEAAARRSQPVDRSWNSEAGKHLKARRNRLLEEWAWTIRADSPLTDDCRAACLAAMQDLQALTADFDTPAEAVLPDLPPLEYVTRQRRKR